MPSGVNINVPFTKSSVVIIGDNLSPVMVDRSAVFGGEIDRDSLTVAGAFLHCTYDHGQFSVSVVPNRLDFRVHESDEVMPHELVEAASQILDVLDQNISGVVISGVAMNHDRITPMGSESGTQSGSEFWRSSFQDGLISQITGEAPSTIWPSSVLRWWHDSIGISLRIEPERASEGQNLFVAVNGYQEINEQTSLRSALSRIGEFKLAAENIHERISRLVE